MLLKMENDVNASLRVSARLRDATPSRTSSASAEISAYGSRIYRIQQPACARNKLW
jgi:hypothetical protein